MGKLIINLIGLSFYLVSAIYFIPLESISISDFLYTLLGIMTGTFILAMNNINMDRISWRVKNE